MIESSSRINTRTNNLQLVLQFKFDINGNYFKAMTKNNLDSIKSVSADIDFTQSYYKPKILDAIVKIRDSKKRPDLDSIFHDISINEASKLTKIQFKFSFLN